METSPADPSATTLSYAGPAVRRGPTHHPPLVGWAWGVLIVETIYRGTLIGIAHLLSPTYPWERFGSNVGDPRLLQGIDSIILLLGAALALLALLPRGFKRWAAVVALVAHLVLLVTKGIGLDVFRLMR